jgi:hypothetical protein
MAFRQSVHGLGRFRRAVVLTPLTIVLSAFATVFVAGVVLVFGTFWATGPINSRQIANPSHTAGRIFRL